MDVPPEDQLHKEALQRICDEWDHAEADIKRAEQVCSEVVMPAVNELRYAGRRVIDAIVLPRDTSDQSKVSALFSDAQFFCQRARHDAIDASVAYMVSNIENMLVTVGPLIIMQCFSELPKLRVGLAGVQKNIVESRKDRENRAQIYKTISECDFESLVDAHTELALSEGLMIQVAEEQKKARADEQRKSRRDRAFGWAGIAFGVIGTGGVVATLIAWKYPHLLGG